MMIGSAKELVLAGLVAAGAVIAIGCERGPGRPPIDTSAIVGNWIELADQAAVNPRARGAEAGKKEHRYLILKADNTFEFSLRTRKGQLTREDTIEGTWAIKENELLFTVTNSTFPDTHEANDWVPESSYGVRKKEVRKRGTTDVLTVVDQMGMPLAYVRAE